MRILWVKADKLLPVQNGGNIRSYHVLRFCRHGMSSRFIPTMEGTRTRTTSVSCSGSCGSSRRVHGQEGTGGSRARPRLSGHVGAQPPYAVSRFANARVQQRIRRWFREQRFDVTVCDFLDAAVNFPGG